MGTVAGGGDGTSRRHGLGTVQNKSQGPGFCHLPDLCHGRAPSLWKNLCLLGNKNKTDGGFLIAAANTVP